VKRDKETKVHKTLHKTKRLTNIEQPHIYTGYECKCAGRISSFCSTSGTRRVTNVKIPVISHEPQKKEGILTTTNGTHPWPSVALILCKSDMSSTLPLGTFRSVASLMTVAGRKTLK
jgi:hypothetical protein